MAALAPVAAVSKLRASAPVFRYVPPAAVPEEAAEAPPAPVPACFADVAEITDVLRMILQFLTPAGMHQFSFMCRAVTCTASEELFATIKTVCPCCRTIFPASWSMRADAASTASDCRMCRSATRATLAPAIVPAVVAPGGYRTVDMARAWFESLTPHSELAAIRAAEAAMDSRQRQALLADQLRAHGIAAPPKSVLVRS